MNLTEAIHMKLLVCCFLTDPPNTFFSIFSIFLYYKNGSFLIFKKQK